ncbi:amino acid adenylation domain-containing protein [Streptomyces sp. NPDC050504]|uniref:amino acid adenylation domain-containing protein n=1 Tax=Streptomyces sp. NPDC050504 TaxID=3365618 RepID=UPI0037B40B86
MPQIQDRTAAVSRGVPAAVAARAGAAPGALAVTDGETWLTYRELMVESGRLAAALRERGVLPGSAVGVLLPHSVRAVVTQLAVWRAGCHYVPLDAAHPQARLRAMLDGSGAALTVGDKALLEGAGISDERALALPFESAPGGTEESWARYGTDARYDPDATAYVMFTSGSTGRPKGVALTHGGIAGLVVEPDFVTVTARDRVLFHSAMTFDASAMEVWIALANGAAVAVSGGDGPAPDKLARDVERLGATVASLTTALFHHLAARRSPVFSVLRTVFVGGEALSAQHARTVLRAHPWLELLNCYGPTEATTLATAHRVLDADCDAPPPIGRPVAGASALVLDERGEPVAPGARGELWIGGSRLASGYLGLPELTAERFVDHPSAGRLYRSGDLVSVRPDGLLEFHGRADDQFKVRGFRIEPGEIEHVLREHADVSGAAAVVQHPSEDDARLVAFVVPAEGRTPTPDGLRAHLAARLPAHLVPGAWEFTGELPLTRSGKVDRKELAGRLVTADAPAAGAALSPLQQVVAEAWSAALNIEVTDPEADFIALGGHSLLALGVVEDLREDLGAELTLADFFAAPTVAGQAELVERALLAAHGEPEEAR